MEVFAATEHMPRIHVEELYPEELEASYTTETNAETFAPFFDEAARLLEKYSSQIKVLVGFETEWLQDGITLIETLLQQHPYDFVVGSVHHVHGVPIDYNRRMYEEARSKSEGGTDEALFEAFFDAQYEMLNALRPPIVGHFDLIRLLSDRPNDDLRTMGKGTVWNRIERNLEFAASQGLILELNSSALRKGLAEPYPKREICQVGTLQISILLALIIWPLRTVLFLSEVRIAGLQNASFLPAPDVYQAYLAKGGKFALSDDSHSIAQVGTNYKLLLDFIVETGIPALSFLETTAPGSGQGPFARFPDTVVRTIELDALKRKQFWTSLDSS
ncbi:MAG: hypothetical protein M4579_006179 [Chaenotheca gracillima]|nr:MAG: hypothetical protein M4579_006179 [Chaenotheca gracillima]